MLHLLKRKRDFYAGGLMVLLGLVAALEGRTYNLGTLRQMGPGYFPVALGVLLICLGVLIAGTAAGSSGDDELIVTRTPDWRGWFCILAGPILFIVLGEIGGLIPATFACVFVSALGDRSTTLKNSLALAVGVTIFGVLLFSYLLKIPMPMWKWGMA